MTVIIRSTTLGVPLLLWWHFLILLLPKYLTYLLPNPIALSVLYPVFYGIGAMISVVWVIGVSYALETAPPVWRLGLIFTLESAGSASNPKEQGLALALEKRLPWLRGALLRYSKKVDAQKSE